MKRIVLWTAALLLIAGSWGGNVWYYNSMQLSEPMFLPHYIAADVRSGSIDLMYLENRSDAGEVTAIRIDELPGLRFEHYEYTRYSHQVAMKAMANWNPDTLGVDAAQLPITVTEATIYYRNKEPRKVPIGEIRIFEGENSGVFEGVSAGGSSDGTGSYSVRLKEPITLEKVDYTFSERLADAFRLELNDRPASESYPIELAAGDTLAFDYEWLGRGDRQADFEGYQIKLLLYMRTADGRSVVETLPISYNVYLSEKQVTRLVRAGGELP